MCTNRFFGCLIFQKITIFVRHKHSVLIMNQIKTYIILFFFFLLVFSGLPVKSQDTLSENYVKRRYFSVNVGRFILKEARFSFEKRVDEKHTRGFTIGIKYSNKNYLKAIGPIPFYYRVTKGVYLGLTTARIGGKSNRVYMTLEPSFGYYYYDIINYSIGSYSWFGNKSSYQSAKSVKIGLSYLVKYKFGMKQGKRGGLFGDFFFGFGGMYNIMDFKTYIVSTYQYNAQPTYIEYSPPEEGMMIYLYPVVHLGFHLGFYFSESNGREDVHKKKNLREPTWKLQLYQD